MAKRNMTVDGNQYEVLIGHNNVKIRGDKLNTVVDFSTLTGMEWADIERGTYKKWFSIKPSVVASYIRRHAAK